MEIFSVFLDMYAMAQKVGNVFNLQFLLANKNFGMA